MTTTTTASHDRLDGTRGRLELLIDERQERLSAGTVPDERLPAAVYDLATAHDALARTHVLLGDVEDARGAYAEAAIYYLSAIRESRARRMTLRPNERHDDPRTCIHGIERGLLADRPDLAECIARETRSMGQRFLVEHDNRSYYAAKLLAAVVLDDDEWERFAEEYRNAITVARPDPAERTGTRPGGDADAGRERRREHRERIVEELAEVGGEGLLATDPARYRADVAQVWDREATPDDDRLFVYEGIAKGEADRVARGLEGLLDRHASYDEAGGWDPPGRPVDDWAGAICLLALWKGLDLGVEAPTVPAALLPEPSESTRVVTRTEPEHYPDAYRDDAAGEYVLTEEVAYPPEGPLAAEDLPEREGDRILSDAWVGATVDRLRASDEAGDGDLADAIEEARRAGELRRHLVVHVGEDDSAVRVDRSVFDLGIDDVEIRRD